jgi:hypothetical protein
MLGVIFSPLTVVIGSVVGVFTLLLGATKKLNEKFMEINNSLMEESQKQTKAFAVMGGDTEENQLLYNALESQGISTSGVFTNINERVARGDLQSYKGANKNDLITEIVSAARERGVVDGRKFLEEMGLSELEPLLYTQQDLSQLKQKAKQFAGTKVKAGGKTLNVNNLSGNSENLLSNAMAGEDQALNDQLLDSKQNIKINEAAIDSNNKIKQFKSATDEIAYNNLAQAVAKATESVEKVNQTLLTDVLEKLNSILEFLTSPIDTILGSWKKNTEALEGKQRQFPMGRGREKDVEESPK